MQTRPLLICFCPGARGDFLAAVLLNMPAKVLARRQINIPLNLYTKLHPTEYDSLTGITLTDYYSIRIKLNDDDFDICASLWATKRLAWQPDTETRRTTLKIAEAAADDFTFDLTIPFKDMFSADRLAEFYFNYTKQTISEERLNAVARGIQQQIITTTYNTVK